MGDLLAEMLRIKEELDALPPLPLAVKLHPADLSTFRHMEAPGPTSLFAAPEVFVDHRVARGRFEIAYTREQVDEWRKEAP